MSQNMRRMIPALIALILGSLLFVDYYVDIPIINIPAAIINSWVSIMAGGAMLVGGLSVITRYGKSIGKKEGTWYPLVVLISMIIMMITGLPGFEEQYALMIDMIRDPLELAAYGMVVFFITSAAFRAFRMRSIDTVFMVIAAFFAFLHDAPMSAAINPLLMYLPGTLINDTVVLAVRRATELSAYMGLFLLWLRTTIGLEHRGLGIE